MGGFPIVIHCRWGLPWISHREFCQSLGQNPSTEILLGSKLPSRLWLKSQPKVKCFRPRGRFTCSKLRLKKPHKQKNKNKWHPDVKHKCCCCCCCCCCWWWCCCCCCCCGRWKKGRTNYHNFARESSVQIENTSIIMPLTQTAMLSWCKTLTSLYFCGLLRHIEAHFKFTYWYGHVLPMLKHTWLASLK